MNNLLKKNPIMHAVAWIGIYVVCVNILDAASESLGVVNLATSFGLFGLSVVLVLYLKRNRKLNEIGLTKFTPFNSRKMLYFIPLIILSVSQFVGKFDSSLTVSQILISALLMINVGFIEEVLFRGLLFSSIKTKSGLTRAILISGITFGLGHIVNLLRGMTVENQLEQILLGIVLGVLLAMIVEITKSLIPGILFHIVFNFSSTIMRSEAKPEFYLLISILVLSFIYAVFLYQTQIKRKEKLVLA